MSQYSKVQGDLLKTNKDIYEVFMSDNTTIQSANFLLQIERGKVPGVTAVNIQGYNAAMPSAWRAPWELANTTAFAFPSSNVDMSFTSTQSENITVQVTGLDINYVSKLATVNFTGSNTGIVTTGTSNFFRINRMQVTKGVATGGVSAKNNSNTYSYIANSAGISQAAIYTVPAGYTFYLNRVTAYSTNNGNQYCSYRINTHKYVEGVFTEQTVLTAPFQQSYNTVRVVPRAYTEKTDIQWELFQTAPAPGSVQLEGILVDNSLTI
jgi:hypothetical protein